MGRLYRVLVPHGSRRDRCAWIAIVTVKKLREGPGPWLRAVKKGLFQLLPLSWRNRILAWAGEEQFFRRHETRHADADAGVERRGLVSVVLPVYQQADLLAASIDSVLAQTWPSLELIVVDDGSTDGVRDVLAKYRGDPRVRAVTQPNQGLPKALSSGFDFATGELFTWTSADNVMKPRQLATLVAFLRERPGVAMVFADYELIDDRGEPLIGGEFRVLDRTDPHDQSVVRPKRQTDDLNRYEDNFIGPCFLYRGRVGRLLGDYNPELGLEDYDYWMRVNRLFRIEHLGSDDVLYRYRVHDNTLSARARELKILERARVLMAYERQRAAWIAAPLRVLADGASHGWLAQCVQAPDTLAPLAAGPLPSLDAAKTLLVVDAARDRGHAVVRPRPSRRLQRGTHAPGAAGAEVDRRAGPPGGRVAAVAASGPGARRRCGRGRHPPHAAGAVGAHAGGRRADRGSRGPPPARGRTDRAQAPRARLLEAGRLGPGQRRAARAGARHPARVRAGHGALSGLSGPPARRRRPRARRSRSPRPRGRGGCSRARSR
jgi:hypothetical protein